MNILPIGDKIVIKQAEAEEVTASGIVLAGQESPQKPAEGIVIAVGPGGTINGEEIDMVVEEGDRVFYSRFAGNTVKLDGEEYVIVRQDDILAIIEE